MSLDQRLRDARDDYRALTPPSTGAHDDVADGRDPSSRRPVSHRTRWVVAAVLVVVAGTVATWAVARDDDRDRIRVAGPSTTTTDAAATTEATMPEPEPGSSAVTLDPVGPYRDGQEVAVRIDPALVEGADLLNEGLRLCVTVVDGEDRSEICPPNVDDLVVFDSVGPSSATVRLRRSVFTDTGTRDCGEAKVDCRIVVLAGDGTRHRSERLTFVEEELPPPEVTLQVEPTGDPGGFTITPEGLAADGSWLDLRVQDQARAGGLPALYVSQCSFGASLGPTPGPFGEDVWGTYSDPAGPDEVVCSSWDPVAEPDPDDPDAALIVTLPTLVYGYGGWADCRVDQCFLDVRRTLIQGVTADGATLGGDESAATALLPRDAEWAAPVRPTLTIETPGPHRGGQVVTVTIAGLPEGERRLIGQCVVGQRWGCGYDLTELGNGTHQVTLFENQLRGCGPESCYLELDASSEGLPPLAVAPLDTPG